MRENKITSFDEWFNNHEFNHLKTGSHKERCEIAWNVACKMKDKEIEKEGFTLSANQCCAEDCGIHFEEGTSLFCKHEQENETLKKKLGEAFEVIKFYARKDLWKELEIKDGQEWEKALIITSHRDQEVIGNTELIGGKRARAFLKGMKVNDEAKLGGSWYKDYIEKIKSLEQEVARLKEENFKLRCCENCVHYDIVTECESTAITCTNYNKWEIKK